MIESKLKHLEFIQNLIARFNNNSFVIKGWSVTLVAALFALAAKDANERYMFVTYVSTIIFWLLDSYYLSKERQFRCLYAQIAVLSDTDFSMDSSQYNRGPNTVYRQPKVDRCGRSAAAVKTEEILLSTLNSLKNMTFPPLDHR